VRDLRRSEARCKDILVTGGRESRALISNARFIKTTARPLGLRMPVPRRVRSAPAPGPPRAEGQRQCSSSPTAFGLDTIHNRQYLVRQLNDHKASIEIADLKGGGLAQYAEMCGELLSRGHARSGDPLALAGYIGSRIDLLTPSWTSRWITPTRPKSTTTLFSTPALRRAQRARS